MKKTHNKKSLLLRFIQVGFSLFLLGSLNVTIAATDVWVANGDGTVTDVATGLIWQQQDDGVERTHANAISFCQNLSLAGNTDWRLPNIKELISLVDYRQRDPAIDRVAFPNTQSTIYWSATSLVLTPTQAYTVPFVTTNGGFESGVLLNTPKTSDAAVRCVR